MSTRSKIDYSQWSEDASPIKDDVKIKTSHNKLTAQTNNSLEAKAWREKNPDKSAKIATMGGEASLKSKTGIHARSKEEMSLHGKKNYEEGRGLAKLTKKQLSENGIKYGKNNLIDEVICEKCGRPVNKGNYALSHGKKCRELDKIKLIKLLPDKFTKAIVKQIAIENNIKKWEQLNILHKTCPYTKCIIKVDNPNQYNPCWYAKNKRELNKIK